MASSERGFIEQVGTGGLLDVQRLDATLDAMARRLDLLAQQGTWVWGRWIDERHVKKRYGQSVLMPAMSAEVRP